MEGRRDLLLLQCLPLTPSPPAVRDMAWAGTLTGNKITSHPLSLTLKLLVEVSVTALCPVSRITHRS